MKINKKSWHYRLNTKVNNNFRSGPPEGLCGYVFCLISGCLNEVGIWLINAAFVLFILSLLSFGAGVVLLRIVLGTDLALRQQPTFMQFLTDPAVHFSTVVGFGVLVGAGLMYLGYRKLKNSKLCPRLEYQ